MAKNEKMSAVLDLRGLDLVTPVDLLKDGHTPYSKNFRLFAQQADDRRVAVSSRKGPGYYMTPLNEALSVSNTATTGASTSNVGVLNGVHAQPFVAANSDRVTRIDIKVANLNSGSGPLMVRLYDNVSGVPSNLLGESSILGGSISDTADYVTARFLEAPKLVSGQTYWIVLQIQDDGKNTYTLSTTTANTHVWTTVNALALISEQTFGLNFRVYTTAELLEKGRFRYNRDGGLNKTLVAYGDTMYAINETTKTLDTVVSGLSASATRYSFDNADGKVFWVNGFDPLTTWNGTFENAAPDIITNPGFEVNTSGWSSSNLSTVTRSTAQFHSGIASAFVTSTGTRRLTQVYAPLLKKGRRYKVTFWVRPEAASNASIVLMNGTTAYITGSTIAIPATTWTKIERYIVPEADSTEISFQSTADAFFDDISVLETGIEHIIDPELPILSDFVFHKDRAFGVVAADRNKLVYSENPGNPSYDPTGTIPTGAREQWYYAWLSVSYWYVPRPKNGSPMTSLTSFQDSLTITTQDNKYVFSGYDRGSFDLRQSTGSKGALSATGVVADENSIVLVADDGIYLHNGSSDKKISDKIAPLFDGCGQKEKIQPVIWKNQIRFYMASQGSAYNDICIIYYKDLDEWVLDTDTYVNGALYYDDADDDQELVEFSSLVPTAYLGEQGYHSLGAPIDFEYRLKYDSMGTPMQRKRLKRFYPILQGVDSTYTLRLDMDRDFEDSPKVKEQLLSTNGAMLGEFTLGDGTLLGGNTSFKPKRQSYSGYAYYWQLRVKRKGVNNRVAFIGAQYIYKAKRL